MAGFDPTRTSYKAVFSKPRPKAGSTRPSDKADPATTAARYDIPELPDDGEAWPDPEPLPDALPLWPL